MNRERIEKQIKKYKKNIVLAQRKHLYESMAYCSGALVELNRILGGFYDGKFNRSV